MLNILEDYLIASDICYGRIDGSIQGPARQRVIKTIPASLASYCPWHLLGLPAGVCLVADG